MVQFFGILRFLQFLVFDFSFIFHRLFGFDCDLWFALCGCDIGYVDIVNHARHLKTCEFSFLFWLLTHITFYHSFSPMKSNIDV